MRRPSPPRLIRRASDRRAAEAHQLETAEFKGSFLVRRVKAPKDRADIGHQLAPFWYASAGGDPPLRKDVQALGRILVRTRVAPATLDDGKRVPYELLLNVELVVQRSAQR